MICDVCGNQHEDKTESREDGIYAYCATYDEWWNLSEAEARFEEFEEQFILEQELQIEKDSMAN